MEKFDLIAQALNQLAFIGTIIGGFALSLAAGIIAKPEKNKFASWTIGFSIAVTASMLVCVLGWSMASFRLYLFSANKNISRLIKTGFTIDELSQFLGLLFLIGIFLFFISLGLSGWNYSQTVGIVTSVIAGLAMIIAVIAILPFL